MTALVMPKKRKMILMNRIIENKNLSEYELNLFNLAIKQRELVSSYIKIGDMVKSRKLRQDACYNVTLANRFRKTRNSTFNFNETRVV